MPLPAPGAAPGPARSPGPTDPLRPGVEPIGRIPVIDVRPVVDCGRRPAKSVVGEEFLVQAKVFREGHDAVNATAVLVDPDGAEHPYPMTSVNPGLVGVAGAGQRRPRRMVELPGRGLVGPVVDVGARRHDQDRGRCRRGAHVRGGRAGPRPAARRSRPTTRVRCARRRRPGGRRRRPDRRRRRTARPGQPPTGALAGRDRPVGPCGLRGRSRCGNWSPPAPPTPCSSSGNARCTAPGTRSSPGPKAPGATR